MSLPNPPSKESKPQPLKNSPENKPSHIEELKKKRRLMDAAYPPKSSRLHFLQRKPREETLNYVVSIKEGKLVKK